MAQVSSGIGWATPLALGRADSTVAVTAHGTERLAQLGGLIEADGGQAVALPGDATELEPARAFFAHAHEAVLGGLGMSRPGVRRQFGRLLDSDDVAEPIIWVLTRPSNVPVGELVMAVAAEG